MLSGLRSRMSVAVVRSFFSVPRAIPSFSAPLRAAPRMTVSFPQTAVRTFADDAGAGAKREMGTVKWFDASKGFGFIVRENGSDLFVHYSAIRGTGYRTIEEGQKVEFTVGQGTKGPTAVDVTLKK